MKVLVIDNDGEGCGVDIAYRAQNAEHDVRYYLPPFQTGKPRLYGDGLVDKVGEWKPSMDWADLVILTGNTILMNDLAAYFGRGYPIFGSNLKGAELETDRELGQKVLKDAGVRVLPYEIVSSAKEAIELIKKTGAAYAMKGWGGDAAKHMSYVASSPEDALFTVSRWEKDDCFSGQLMMQEKVDGVEVGISGMFGPGGWNAALEESFEYKKFLNDDLGENTGEMGTAIRHVTKSKLFDQVLEPVTDYLHGINYVGDCSVNCIVDAKGVPWPLEFTMRLGWPDFCIRQSIIRDDPVAWMKALIEGKDRLRISSDVAVGVCLTHGDFPRGGPSDSRPKDPLTAWAGYPVYGVSDRVEQSIHWQQAMMAKVPMLIGGEVRESSMICTAGNYPCVVTGTGRTIKAARDAAYEVVWGLKIPSNMMFRTDIGEGLEAQVKLLQKHGYLEGMR